jgi:hypothetical protein
MKSLSPVLSSYLEELPQIGSPDVSGALAVFSLIGPMPVLEYQSFAQGRAAGVTIKELGDGASVRDLVVFNPTDVPVLLFEGEEVLGAQQNRTFDISVLVPAHSELKVPVSCVEAGRWDGSRHSEDFAPAPQAAYPSLRRLKSEHVRRAVAAGMEARADQSAVWDNVGRMAGDRGVIAPTGAMHDVFEHERGRIADICGAVSMKCSQTGMLVAIGGEFTVLDRVSQPDVLDSLFAPLVQGYALDAVAVAPTDPPSVDEARAWLERVLSAPLQERDGIGAGRDVRVAGEGFAGAGLVSGVELVQLSVYADDPESDESDARLLGGRIRRPSRRGAR